MVFREPLNRHLDSLVRPYIRSRSTFQVCGYTGLLVAIVLTMSLTAFRGRSLWVMAGLTIAAVCTFFTLTMLAKIIQGEESLTYYHHKIAVLIVSTLLLWLLGQPVLPYLDMALLGVGGFLVCGRVGCLMVGCCHGRPCDWGVCYSAEHADEGFTPYYVGVRLLPIQAIESLWVLIVVVIGSGIVLSDYPPGSALTWYIVTYSIGRFSFEFVRGDPARPYYACFSEAQWTSLLLILMVLSGEIAGILEFYLWHELVAAGMVLAMIGFTFQRHVRKTNRFALLHPRHIREIANIINGDAGEIDVKTTSQGISLSVSRLPDHQVYTFSTLHDTLTAPAAAILTGCVLQLNHHSGSHQLIEGDSGVFHLIVSIASV
jgi:hypothetical protein